MAPSHCLLAVLLGLALLAGDVSGRDLLVKMEKEGPKESDVACSNPVKYEIFNDCIWSSARHPTDYPEDAHWSPLCGTAHNAEYTMWGEGLISTTGVKNVAETGNCSVLQEEVESCIESNYCAWYSQTPCSEFGGTCNHTSAVNMTAGYPYLSMLTMIAPSPDWMTGIAGVKLCSENGYWLTTYSRELGAYDAGTDSGVTFASEDAPTDPFEGISEFTAKDDTNIFYNPEKMALYPVCTITLTLKVE